MADLRQELRARGYRLTPQRQLVLEAVRKLEHATPEALANEVRRTASGINITTIYRTLELLEGLGLVRHTHLDHGAPVYHTPDHEHLHVVCHTCSDVSAAPVELVEDVVGRMARERGFTVDVGHLTLFGTCARCAQDVPSTDGRE